ncbi:MarR family transcriptional regulator [Thermodesulfobacteriota bacterium]
MKDRHNITRILNLLEKNGFISRTPDGEDKRRLNVYLTKEGKVGDKIVLSGPGWILPAECTNKENTCLFTVSELVPFSFT